MPRIRSRPPFLSSTLMCPAPASMALSNSSRTTDAGRSITSPAAIFEATSSGRTRIDRCGGGLVGGRGTAFISGYEEWADFKPQHVDQALVGELQLGDNRQRQEGHLHVGVLQRAAQ